jgi:hypothetical protein
VHGLLRAQRVGDEVQGKVARAGGATVDALAMTQAVQLMERGRGTVPHTAGSTGTDGGRASRTMEAGAESGSNDEMAGRLAMLLQLRGGGNELDAYFPMRVQGVSGSILTFAALTSVVMGGHAGAFCRYNSSTSRVTTLLVRINTAGTRVDRGAY